MRFHICLLQLAALLLVLLVAVDGKVSLATEGLYRRSTGAHGRLTSHLLAASRLCSQPWLDRLSGS